MAKKKREAPSYPVTTVVDGKTYRGEYRISRGMVMVSSDYGLKETQLGGSPADALAAMLLVELVREWLAKGGKSS